MLTTGRLQTQPKTCWKLQSGGYLKRTV